MNGWLTVLFFELKTVTMNKIHIMQTFFLKNDIDALRKFRFWAFRGG